MSYFLRGLWVAFKWIVALAICGGIVAGLSYYKYNEIQAAIAAGEAYPEHSETVEATMVGSTEYAPFIKVIGQAVSPEYVLLLNELPGRIVAVNHQAGANVTAGDIVVQLDVSEELAKIASIRAKAELGRMTAARMNRLRKSHAASGASVEKAEADVAVAEAEIKALESVVQKKTIRAPFDGVLGIHQLEVGQYLEAGNEIASLVGQADQMWVDFRLPQAQGELGPGSEVRIRPIRYRDSESPSVPFAVARVLAKDTVIASNSRSLRYRAELARDALPLRHNAALEIRVPIAPSKEMLCVPSAAIQHDRFGKFVYVLQPDAAQPAAETGSPAPPQTPQRPAYRAQRRTVTILGTQGEMTVIGSGLQPDERVAVAGAFKLHDGLLVYVHVDNAPKSTRQSG